MADVDISRYCPGCVFVAYQKEHPSGGSVAGRQYSDRISANNCCVCINHRCKWILDVYILVGMTEQDTERPRFDYLIQTGDQQEFKVIHGHAEGVPPNAVVRRWHDDKGNEYTEVHPYAVLEELPADQGRGRFIIRLYEKAKDEMQEHPKTYAGFAAAGIITGVATGIVRLSRHRRKQ